MLTFRDLLWTLSHCELLALEKALCNVEDSGLSWDLAEEDYHEGYPLPNVDDYVQKVCQDYTSCKQLISNMVSFVSPRCPTPPSTVLDENVPSRAGYELSSGLQSAHTTRVPFVRNTASNSEMQVYDEHHLADDVVTPHACDGGQCPCVCGINDDEHRSVHVDKGHKDGVYSPSHNSTPTKRTRDSTLSRQVFLHELSHFSPSGHSFGNSPSNWDSNR